MTHPRLFRPALLPLALLSAGLLLTSCDHFVAIEGTVYESPKEGAFSGVFLQTGTAKVEKLQPLSNVDFRQDYPKASEAVSDKNGDFRLSCVTGSEPSEIRFTVSKPGYETLTGTVHNGDKCIIFLRRATEKKK